jgi:alpha-tubulin suppressor-like RCC1 family protein
MSSSVFQFGVNEYGQLGNGATGLEEYATFATGVYMSIGDTGMVACGFGHTAIIDEKYNLYTCGSNFYGQLGLGETANNGVDDPNPYFMQVNVTGITGFSGGVKEVSCGIAHTAIIDENYNLYTCGLNLYGQLGLGASGNAGIDPNPYFMQVNVTGITGFSGGVKQVSCGRFHTAIIDKYENLYTCGYNEYGQLGLGETANFGTTDPNPYFMQVNVTGITGFSGGVKQVSCGAHHTAIRDTYENLYTCGYNFYGQLGLGTSGNTGNDPNPYFMQVNVTGITGFSGGVIQVSCGGEFTAIIDTYDNLYTCGYNEYGQLGLGASGNTGEDPNPYFMPVNVTGITGFSGGVKQVSCGRSHTAILDDYNIYTCGQTEFIGRGTTYSQSSFYPLAYNSEPHPKLPPAFTYKWFSYGSSASSVFAGGFGDVTCFCEGTKILSLNCSQSQLSEQDLVEEYRLIQELKVGDFVKSYQHGYRKISKMLSGTFINNPTDDDVSNCMYRMIKTKDNGLIDDVIITRNHGVLVEKLSEREEKKVDINNLEMIDGLISIIAAKCDTFEKVEDIKRYKYWHFSLETDGDNDRRFGVWANGLLVETPSNNMMDNATNVKPLDF